MWCFCLEHISFPSTACGRGVRGEGGEGWREHTCCHFDRREKPDHAMNDVEPSSVIRGSPGATLLHQLSSKDGTGTRAPLSSPRRVYFSYKYWRSVAVTPTASTGNLLSSRSLIYR